MVRGATAPGAGRRERRRAIWAAAPDITGYQGFHSFDDAAIIVTGLESIKLIEVECVLTRDPAVSESPR
jgi:hypothetical protein